jgi:hypothetical protein
VSRDPSFMTTSDVYFKKEPEETMSHWRFPQEWDTSPAGERTPKSQDQKSWRSRGRLASPRVQRKTVGVARALKPITESIRPLCALAAVDETHLEYSICGASVDLLSGTPAAKLRLLASTRSSMTAAATPGTAPE